MTFVSRLHPVTRLLAWLMLLLLVQCLTGWWLAAAFLAVPALPRRVLRRAGGLIRRTRWLLLSLFVVFAWGTAGEPASAQFGLPEFAGSPTIEGLREGGLHLGRLLLALVVVAAFLEYLPLAALLSACNHLARPFTRFAGDAERAALRLHLALHYVETLPRPRDWRTLLETPPAPARTVLVLENRAMASLDYACLLLGAGLLFGVCLLGGGL